MINSMNKEEPNERTNDYWIEASRLASLYGKKPEVQKKERRGVIIYWGIMLVFSLLINPLFLLFLLWLNLGESFGYFEFLFSPLVKAVWFFISAVCITFSVWFIPKPEKESWAMALKELDNNNVPLSH